MPWTRRYDEPEPQRVNRWLAQQGVCSRREAEGLIAEGRVSIDGEVVSDAGRKIEPGQTLTLSEGTAAKADSRFSAMVNKPVGLVSAHPEHGQVPAVRLLTAANLWGGEGTAPDPRASLAPMGRLDMDSRGLLILSDDGVLAKAVIGPESDLEKEYLVRVTGVVTPKKLDQLRFGLQRRRPPAQARQGRTRSTDHQLRFILKEGRKRQIRRMCELVGLHVVDLVRVRIGEVRLGDLPEGNGGR